MKHRQEKASPEIDYAEISIPVDRYFGTGTFVTVTKPGALSGGKVVASLMIMVPAFQISLNVNPSTKDIPVLLGLADGSPPRSSKIYFFPENIDSLEPHDFQVTFEDWEITGLSVDGACLELKEWTVMNSLSAEKKHAEYLGRLITNLHTLETTIRDFLLTASEGLKSSAEHAQSLRDLRVGQSAPLNPFTSYDDLRALIVKYNKRVQSTANRLVIDENLVKLRDAIAHGRVFSFEPSCPLLLLKFSKPEGSFVKVEFSATMTPDWFGNQIKRVNGEFSKVVEASRLLTSGKL